MRFACLGSGSRGNATVVEAGGTCVMIDCGLPVREVEFRLARLGKEPSDLAALIVTHEHTDHVGNIGPLARRYRLPVWMTAGTRVNSNQGELPGLTLFSSHEPFAVGDLSVQPFPVPHDAREPVQFVFGDGSVRLGVFTDAGAVTPHVEAMLEGCDALMLECNHDARMLANGPYPPSLKARVGGRFGHLSNYQAAELLGRLRHGKLKHVVAAHLSEKNNTPELARAALSEVLGCAPDCIDVAHQDHGLEWREIA